MARRRDGRELVEVFKELTTSPPPGDTGKEHPQVARTVPAPASEPSALGDDRPVHEFRLGDRRQVEVVLSMAWVHGLAIFAFLLLAGSFVLGRHFAPPTEPVDTVETAEALVEEMSRVGQVTVQPNQPARLSPVRAGGSSAGTQAAASGTGGSAVGQALPAVAQPPVVASGDMYALCVITYFNRASNRALADASAKFLQDKGFANVRVLTQRETGNIVVAVGSFATKDDPEVKRLSDALTTVSYSGGTPFAKAFVISLRGYQ